MNLFAAALFALCFPNTGMIVAPPVMTAHVEAAVEAQGEVFILTAYSCYDAECLTASGHRAGPGSVGVPMSGPAAFALLGTVLEIEGIGRLIVDDHCLGCEGMWLDVWQPNREAEIEFGRKTAMVYRIR